MKRSILYEQVDIDEQIHEQNNIEKSFHMFPDYLHDILTCKICLLPYDLEKRVAYNLCKNSHKCCHQCLNLYFSGENVMCPQCRQLLIKQNFKKDRIISEVIEGQLKDIVSKKKQISQKRMKQQWQRKFEKQRQLQQKKQIEQKIKLKYQYQRQLLQKKILKKQLQNQKQQRIRSKIQRQMQRQRLLREKQHIQRQKRLLQEQKKINKQKQKKQKQKSLLLLKQNKQVDLPLLTQINQKAKQNLKNLKILTRGLIVNILLLAFLQCPFMISNFDYSNKYKDMNCMDKSYNIGMTLRQYFISSAYFGLSLYIISMVPYFIYIFIKQKIFFRVSYVCLVIIVFIKMVVFNFIVILIWSGIDYNDKNSCNSNISQYVDIFVFTYCSGIIFGNIINIKVMKNLLK